MEITKPIAASLKPESTISHYKIKELIAVGGMGQVYRALDLQLGRVVALKTIRPVSSVDPHAHQRFLREARAASILSHPSICTIYEIGQEADLTFIAMQHVSGKTIEDMLSQGPLSIETILSCALDVIDALDEAHKHGVIHRDIKPSNIMLNDRGVAVVLDFGLAKQVSLTTESNEDLPTLVHLTAATTLLGTMPYMPPEEISGELLDARSDIFSFGVTLYEMLTGTRPFEGLHKVDLLHAILHDEPKPLPEVRPEVDASLNAIVSRTLMKKPSDRFQSASELREELAAYIQSQGYAVRTISRRSISGISSEIPRTGQSRRKWNTTSERQIRSRAFLQRLPLILLIAAGVTAAIWWLFVRSPTQPDANLSSLRQVELVSWKNEPGELSIFGSLSPDGTMIAYSPISGGNRNIWIKQIIGGNPIEVIKDEWANQNPIWSPDGQQIAFVSSRGKQSGIWRIPYLGGTPTLIATIKEGVFPTLTSWSKDQSTIYFELQSKLFALKIDSGQINQLSGSDPTWQDLQDFSISADEHQVAYVRNEGGKWNVWVRPITGGNPIQITNDAAEDKYPVWHPDGKRVIYSSIRDGTYQICAAYLDGRKPMQITSGESDKFVSSVSNDGARILYGSLREESDIWGVRVETGETFEVTSDTGCELWPDISPDNKMIAFQAIKQPGRGAKLRSCSLMIKPLSAGGQQMQLAARAYDARWSHDGSQVAFLRDAGSATNIWIIQATGGGERQVTTEGIIGGRFTVLPYNRLESANYGWSPDNKKLIYCSKKSPAGSTVNIISADGSDKPTIINTTESDRFNSPLWSPDGNRAMYLSQAIEKSAGKALWSVWQTDTSLRKTETIFQTDSVLRLLGWLGLTKDVIVATVEGKHSGSQNAADVNLIRITNGGGNQVVARLQSAYLYNIQLSPDGRMLAFASHQDGADNIWLIPAIGGPARRITTNSDPRLYFSSLSWSPDGKAIYYGKQTTDSFISAINDFK